jgi:tripartite-type tricarboxylate transporter receptor subunit TctC
MTRRRLLLIAATALMSGTPFVPAAEQSSYPNRQIRLIVPTPPGGVSDACARLLAQALSKSMGQMVVVENKPGASGALAAQALIAAPPDGHTLLWTLSSMSGLAFVQKAPPYQSLAELTPV